MWEQLLIPSSPTKCVSGITQQSDTVLDLSHQFSVSFLCRGKASSLKSLTKATMRCAYLSASAPSILGVTKAFESLMSTKDSLMTAEDLGTHPIKIRRQKIRQKLRATQTQCCSRLNAHPILVQEGRDEIQWDLYGTRSVNPEKKSVVWKTSYTKRRELRETKLSVRLINTTYERRLVQGHRNTRQLRVKWGIEDVYNELDNGAKGCNSCMKSPEFYCFR
ncbi:hypothetical protein TNCV_4394201 [Trichonephila clavipes]|uniref:Uncharacterized protein n=1 Tax=Trichonephila clavipes TaxID=2585209 RepID=A0A8X6W586_TRICX|nr:hypothetical protein TNCV_4394201 [Trichonephila clavipes]